MARGVDGHVRQAHDKRAFYVQRMQIELPPLCSDSRSHAWVCFGRGEERRGVEGRRGEEERTREERRGEEWRRGEEKRGEEERRGVEGGGGARKRVDDTHTRTR